MAIIRSCMWVHKIGAVRAAVGLGLHRTVRAEPTLTLIGLAAIAALCNG